MSKLSKRRQSGRFVGMGGAGREDNASPEGKLHLRRYFLKKYHAATKPVVLDCCQAGGVLWSALRDEFEVKYLGVDRVGKKGRLAIDSARLLMLPGLPYDVIDVDTYGSPWQHWKNLLPNLAQPTTVFLTLGKAGGLTSVDSAVIQSLGLQRMKRAIPQALRWKLDQLAVDSCLSLAYHYGIKINEALECIPPSTNARYFGLRLEPPVLRTFRTTRSTERAESGHRISGVEEITQTVRGGNSKRAP
jgi:hypothetical protein